MGKSSSDAGAHNKPLAFFPYTLFYYTLCCLIRWWGAVKDSNPNVQQVTEEILKAYGLWGERAYAIVGVIASHLLHVGADEVIKMWDDMYAQYYVPYVLGDK